MRMKLGIIISRLFITEQSSMEVNVLYQETKLK